MTVEQAPMNRAEAERITERIRIALDRVSTAWADLGERIAEAYQRRADLALGYGSWAEYAEAELKPAEGVAAEVRRQLVGMLSAQGMSTRAIAPAVGVNQSNVVRDIQVMQSASSEPERIDPHTGEIVTGPHVEPLAPVGKSLGLDGKTYRRPEGHERPSETAARIIAEAKPAAAQRRPITDTFWESVYDTAKEIDKLQRLTEDDRFARNRPAIAERNLNQLKQTANTLARVLAAIESN